MSIDKLSVAAQAAGYAMALDETAEATVRHRSLGGPKADAHRHAAAGQTTEVVVTKVSRPAPGWNAPWTFWKTA